MSSLVTMLGQVLTMLILTWLSAPGGLKLPGLMLMLLSILLYSSPMILVRSEPPLPMFPAAALLRMIHFYSQTQ